MARRATLRDVAQAAGVSINTASRALNHKPDVKESTRERILDAAKELAYVPNALAQALKGKPTRSIGIIVDDFANPFFSEVLKGVEEVAADRGYAVTVGSSSGDPAKELQLIQTMLEQRTAGILWTPTQKDAACLELLQKEELPHVLVARRFEQASSQAVLNDDVAGSFQATQYLLQNGYRRILFLNATEQLWSAQQRLLGYQRALAEAGLPFDPTLVHYCTPGLQESYETTLTVIQAALDAHACPDALFVFSDYMALGAIKALRELDLRIPEDLAVMGYDGIDIGEMISPTLSTVRIAKRRLGREAVRMLLDRIEDSPAAEQRGQETILSPELIIRQSTPSRLSRVSDSLSVE